jgi:DNA-binding response OmpR family regulator
MARRRNVLLIEDDPNLRLMFRTALVLEGFNVREANDGLEALLVVEAEMPDVIVLDLGLPRVNGKGVLSELSAHASTRGIPVVIVTASREPVEEVSSDCILRKPVEPDELVATVRRCLTSVSEH